MSAKNEQPTTKVISKSVSMPSTLWGITDAHAKTTEWKDRSGYIRNLVEKDLMTEGKIGNAKEDSIELFAKINKAVKVGGDAVVKRFERVAQDVLKEDRIKRAS